MRKSSLTISLAALLVTFGCNRAADEQQKADDARADANQEIAEAHQEAQREIQSARDEASEEIAKANANFGKMRAEALADVNRKLADLDREIAALETKLAGASGDAKANLEAKLPEVRRLREAFVSEYRLLESAAATTWDQTKERVNQALEKLDQAVDNAD